MTFCDYLENEILDQVFGGSDFSETGTMYFGLSTDCSDAGAITGEPSGNNYSRKSMTNNKTTWGNASSGALSNAVDITFATASGSWGTLDTFFISDASSGDTNTYAYGALSEAKSIGSGDTPKFATGDLDITLD